MWQFSELPVPQWPGQTSMFTNPSFIDEEKKRDVAKFSSPKVSVYKFMLKIFLV